MSTSSRETVLSTFKSPKKPGGLSGLQKLHKHTKVGRKTIQDILTEEEAYTLHTPIKKRFKRRRVITNGPGEQIQMDLMDLSHLKQYNDGVVFLLTAIDVFSKKAFATPIKSKSADMMREAISKVISHHFPSIRYIQTDRGLEFLNKKVQQLLKSKNITHFHTYNDEIKAGIVERFNRTLRMKIWRYFTSMSTFRYIDVLPSLIESYNSSYHSSIGMTPNEVTHQNSEKVWWTIYNNLPVPKTNMLKEGDYVRIVMNIKRFQKEATPGCSKEIFQVKTILSTSPPTYSICDLNQETLKGTFYREELQKVKLPSTFKIEKVLKRRGKNKNRELFVKWEGYPNSFNSWIKASELHS